MRFSLENRINFPKKNKTNAKLRTMKSLHKCQGSENRSKVSGEKITRMETQFVAKKMESQM